MACQSAPQGGGAGAVCQSSPGGRDPGGGGDRGGADPELVVAALLHDSIEVQEVPRAVLAVAEADRKIEIETGNK